MSASVVYTTNMAIPTPPVHVSADNLYYGSTHPDVAVFQAALVRYMNIAIPISGTYDDETDNAVRYYAQHPDTVNAGITLSREYRGTEAPTGNFILMIGLLPR